MGTTLNGQQIKNTYNGLIKTSNTGSLPATTNVVAIGDGVGNDSPLALGQAGVGIGAAMSTIEASSILQVDSTTKGVLLPRMTTTQRDAIASPANGLVVYNTTTDTIDFFDGTNWAQNNKVANNYGSWYSKLNQTAISTGSRVIFEETDFQKNISVDTDGTNLNQITFQESGIYNIQFSLQFQNLHNQERDIYIWLGKNGGQLANTGSIAFVPKSNGSGTPGHTILAWNYFVQVTGGEYLTLEWSTNDLTNVTMQFYSPAVYPDVPSAILTVSQIA